MDDIARQLRDEICSLEEHITRTENRLLAARWAEDLLEPFEQVESHLDEGDLRNVLRAFRTARQHFRVNGRIADRIDDILARYPDLAPPAATEETADGGYDEVVLTPDNDPGDTTSVDDADSLFFVDDEEVADDAGGDDVFDTAELADTPDTDTPDTDTSDVAAAQTLFAAEPDAAAPPPADAPEAAAPPLPGVSSDELFADTEAPAPPQAPSAKAPADGAARPSPRALKEPAGPPPARTAHEKDSRIRAARAPEVEPDSETFDILAHSIELDDLAAALDVEISTDDRTFYEARRTTRMNDRVTATLRQNRSAQGQYILLPRLTQLRPRGGGALAVTVKNLAKRYISLFGDIRDLMRYRNEGFMSSETPERGWALITAECPRESMGKNYMEQNQYLRYLAASLSIPSHLVRRRSMVETIYDLIVGHLALGQRFQRGSLDWTTSTPAKNDFVCVYFPDEGIRVRDLSRVTHHRSLGITPTW